MALNPILVFLLSILIGFLLGLVFLLVSRLVTPPRRVGDKHIVYESGSRPLPSKLRYFGQKYFPFIIVYVSFDVLMSYSIALLGSMPSRADIVLLGVFSSLVFAALLVAIYVDALKW